MSSYMYIAKVVTLLSYNAKDKVRNRFKFPPLVILLVD